MAACVRTFLLPICLLLLFGVLQSKAWEVAVKDKANKTCLYASIMLNITIQYETNNGSFNNATLASPSEVKHNGSRCGTATLAPLLFVDLGRGHTWSLNFTRSNSSYEGNVITFTYNTTDAELFPDGKPNGTVITETPAVPQLFTSIPLKTKYKCNHPDLIQVDNVVQIYWNVILQAYIENGTIGENVTECDADLSTTAPPAPTIPASTPAPTKPTPSKPSAGTYSVKTGNETCLLATMGLQLNVSQMRSPVNINPNTTSSSGHCDNHTATMVLNDSNTGAIEFGFVLANGHFHLENVTITLIDQPFESFANNNLSYWDATLGSSYMCLKQQTIGVGTNVSVNVFDVRVQPFQVKNGIFSTAQECSLDDDGILIPIIVGASLAGLIVIIVIAYIIGRRKSYAGYHTL
ncbi:lysosome-associated membrane glycoprotein 2-like isoform X1 [Lissotriton helveticus]